MHPNPHLLAPEGVVEGRELGVAAHGGLVGARVQRRVRGDGGRADALRLELVYVRPTEEELARQVRRLDAVLRGGARAERRRDCRCGLGRKETRRSCCCCCCWKRGKRRRGERRISARTHHSKGQFSHLNEQCRRCTRHARYNHVLLVFDDVLGDLLRTGVAPGVCVRARCGTRRASLDPASRTEDGRPR